MAIWALAIASFCVTGCGGSEIAQQSASGPGVRATQPNTLAEIKVKSDGETVAFFIEPAKDGVKIVDAGRAELWRLTWKGDDVKVKAPDDQPMAFATSSLSGNIKIRDGGGEVVQFVVVPQSGGAWKLEDDAEQLLTRIKKREYGFELESPSDTSLAKVKLKEGKTSLRDANDVTLLYTKDPVPTLAFVAFGLTQLSPEQQFALFLQWSKR